MIFQKSIPLERLKNTTKIPHKPCIPDHWNFVEEVRNFRVDTYIIKMYNDETGKKMLLDGTKMNSNYVELIGDGKEHTIEIYL